ncbi:hypothetical protein S7711_09171 [Stachybotrys chartarum IBT 7711]|uniref:Replication factor A protein 3 n=1 Tax=Stachybotrys chartarum (strain CBS 109288 / IBT 7711) TaxID=1280523 RepID=A0A084ALR4_STACB|nr:hypothetical protein S7711_09171 [Stachybotrys chartarum IBT 7711]
MAEAQVNSPRITAPYLDSFRGREITLVGRVAQLLGSQATIDSDGLVTLILNQDSHLTNGNAAQIKGKVNPDLSVKVLSAQDLGPDIGHGGREPQDPAECTLPLHPARVAMVWPLTRNDDHASHSKPTTSSTPPSTQPLKPSSLTHNNPVGAESCESSCPYPTPTSSEEPAILMSSVVIAGTEPSSGHVPSDYALIPSPSGSFSGSAPDCHSQDLLIPSAQIIQRPNVSTSSSSSSLSDLSPPMPSPPSSDLLYSSSWLSTNVSNTNATNVASEARQAPIRLAADDDTSWQGPQPRIQKPQDSDELWESVLEGIGRIHVAMDLDNAGRWRIRRHGGELM